MFIEWKTIPWLLITMFSTNMRLKYNLLSFCNSQQLASVQKSFLMECLQQLAKYQKSIASIFLIKSWIYFSRWAGLGQAHCWCGDSLVWCQCGFIKVFFLHLLWFFLINVYNKNNYFTFMSLILWSFPIMCTIHTIRLI